jgi:hypothetical protein
MEKQDKEFLEYRRKHYLYVIGGYYFDIRTNERLTYEQGYRKYKKEMT